MFDIALGIFLFLSPVFTLIGNNARVNGQVAALQFYQFKSFSLSSAVIQAQFFQYGVLALLIIALGQNPARKFQNKWLAGFLAVCAFSVLAHPKTTSTFIFILLGCLLYYLVVVYAKSLKPVVYPIFLVSTINTVFAVLQFFNISPFYKFAGLMCSQSHLGIYQAVALPICYSINPFFSIIPLIGLLLSKSFTPLLALSIGAVYFFYHNKKVRHYISTPIGLTSISGVLIFFLIRNYHTIIHKLSLRITVWGYALTDILNHPFAGSGLGIFSFTNKWGHWEWMYNEYLAVVLYIGLPGLFFLIMFLKNSFNGLKDRGITAACLIIAVSCLFQSPLHFARLAGTIIPLFAFMEILKRKDRL